MLVQSASLPGRRSFFTAVLREVSFSARRRSRSSARSIDEVQQLVGLQRIARQPVVERILDRLFDDLLRFRRGKPVLGLALEFRLAHEHRKHHGRADHHVFRGDGGGALALADALGVVLQAAQHRAAHAGFVGAAVGRRHGVAIGGEEAVGIRRPRRPPIRRRHGRRCGRTCRRRYPDAPACRREWRRRDSPSGRPGNGSCPRRERPRCLSTAPDRSASGFRRRRTDRLSSASS